MRFWTSDEHYNHDNIIRFCKRPFADRIEMKEALIAAHNAKVTRGDVTYHLGDMFWKDTPEHEAIEILNRLNGRHILVWGNHDEVIKKSPAIQTKFLKIADILYLEKTKTMPTMYVSHYAQRVWRNSHNGSYHVYGHSHAALPEANTLSFDVGVDTRPDYAPWSDEEIDAKMKAKIKAGAMDEMSKQIADNPWDKAEGSSVLYPAPQVVPELIEPLQMPIIPPEVWQALKEATAQIKRTTGSDIINGRCI